MASGDWVTKSVVEGKVDKTADLLRISLPNSTVGTIEK